MRCFCCLLLLLGVSLFIYLLVVAGFEFVNCLWIVDWSKPSVQCC